MAVFKATKNRKETSNNTFKATKNRSVDSGYVYKLENSLNRSSSLLDEYTRKRTNGDFIDRDSFSTYKKALDDYEKAYSGLNIGNRNNANARNSNAGADYISSLRGDIEKAAGYYGQFDTEDQYKVAVRDSKYRSKYEGMSYGDISKALDTLSKQSGRAHIGGYDNAKELDDEIEWLNNYKRSDRAVIDSMTSEEIGNLISENKEKISSLQEERERLITEQKRATMMGRGANVNSSESYKSNNNRIAEIDEEISSLQDPVMYHNGDGSAVTLERLRWAKNIEDNIGNITTNPQLKSAYEALSTYKEDIGRAEGAMEALKGGDTSDVHRSDLEYIIEKYGINTDGNTDESISYDIYSNVYLPLISGNYAGQTDNKTLLENSGYSWNDIEEYHDFYAAKERAAELDKSYDYFAQSYPGLATASAIAAAPGQLVDYAGNIIDAARGKMPNAYDDGFTNFIQQSNESVTKKIDDSIDNEVLSWLATGAYSGVTSSLQSAITGAACTAIFGPAAGAKVALGVMGSEAAASAFNSAVKNGSTNGQALIYSVSSGVFEAVFEKLPLDHIIKVSGAGLDVHTLSSYLKSVAKSSKNAIAQGLIEGGEEFGTEVFNKIADGIINRDHSEYENAILRYKEAGYSEEDAKRLAGTDLINDILQATYGGFVGGAGTGTVQNVSMASKYAPSAILNNMENNAELATQGSIIINEGNISSDIESAKASGDGRIRRQAKAIERVYNRKTDDINTENGKNSAKKQVKSSDFSVKELRNIGRLYDEISDREIKKKLNNGKEQFRTEIRRELKKLNVADIKDAERVIFKKMYVGSLRPSEERFFREIGGKNITDKIIKAIGDPREETSTDEAVGDTAAETINVAVSNTDGSKLADVILDNGNIYAVAENGEAVAPEEFLASSSDDAAVLSRLSAINDEYGLDTEGVHAIFGEWTNYTGELSAEEFMRGAEIAYRNGLINRTGSKNPAFAKLGNVADNVFKIGREAAERRVANDTSNVSVPSPTGTQPKSNKKGTVKFEGISREKLNHEQKVQVDFVGRIFEAIGTDVIFYNSNGEGESGSYDSETNTFRIDVNAGNTKKHSLITFTAAHELTHFIRRWSPDKFKIFADFLIDRYSKNNVPIEALIKQQRENAEGELSYDDAYEEVVCEACQEFLRDSDAKNALLEIRERDKGLFEKITEFIADLIEKLNSVIGTWKAEGHEARYVREMTDAVEDLRKLWDDALLSATENYKAADGVSETARGVKNQHRNYFVEDKYFKSQMSRWEDLKHGAYVKVGEIGSAHPLHTIGMPAGVLRYDVDKLKKNMADHSDYLTVELLQSIPEIIANPIAISEYSAENTVSVFGNIFVGKSPMMVGVTISKDNASNDISKVRTFNARKDVGKLITDKTVLYLNESKKETQKWFLACGIQVPLGETKFGFIRSISQKQADVNNSSNKKQRRREILSDEDMKNLLKKSAEENKVLRETLANVREFNSLQKQRTGGLRHTRSSVESAASLLMKRYDIKRGKGQIADALESFYSKIAAINGTVTDWEDVEKWAEETVNVIQKLSEKKPKRDSYAQETLNRIRKTRLSLSEDQKEEVALQYDSYDAFRKHYMGSLTLANDGASLSDNATWTELCTLCPELLDINTIEAERGSALAEAVDSLKSSYVIEEEIDETAWGRELTYAIFDTYWDVNTLVTQADRYQRHINELKAAHKKNIAKLREQHTNELSDMREKHKRALRQVRESREAQKKYYQDMRKRGIDKRKATRLRGKLRKRVHDLDMLFRHGKKERNVKEELKELTSTMLRSADIIFHDGLSNEDIIRLYRGTSVSDKQKTLISEYENLLKRKDELLKIDNASTEELADIEAQIERLDEDLSEYLSARRNAHREESVSTALTELKEAYEQIAVSDKKYISGVYDQNVLDHLSELAKSSDGIGKKRFTDLTENELQQLYDAYTMVYTAIKNSNKTFMTDKNSTLEETVKNTFDEIESMRKRGITGRIQKVLNNLNFSMLMPEYFFDVLGSKTLSKLYKNIANGENIWYRDVAHARKFHRDLCEELKYDKWKKSLDDKLEFEDADGDTFTLKRSECMLIYAYNKREAAIGTDHLRQGGITIANTLQGKNKDEESYSHKLTEETISKIISEVSEQQKKYADEMVKYLSSVMGEKGNEITMQLYGVKKYTEQYYIPFISDANYIIKKDDKAVKKGRRIINSSFTNDITKGANNALAIGSFDDIWCEHVDAMSIYHAFTIPLEDLKRVRNIKFAKEGKENLVSVNAALDTIYGKKAQQYIDKLIEDLEGGVRTDSSQFFDKATSLAKKTAVLASASVVIQQPSSIARAFAYIEPHYFINSPFSIFKHRKEWEELKRHCPVAGIKEMGRFSTHMGPKTSDWILDRGKVRDKLDDFLSAPAAFADEITWVAIWNAAKRKAAKTSGYTVGSTKFYEAAEDIFNTTINKTQVADSVFRRSELMRSNNSFLRNTTAFMNEPTVQLNMLISAIYEGKRAKGFNKIAIPAKIGASLLASVTLNALLKSLVSAMRDEDDDETYTEKYVQHYRENFFDGINPLSNIPIVKEVYSKYLGYEPTTLEMDLVSDAIDAIKGLESEKKTTYEKTVAITGVVAKIFGIPFSNIERDVRTFSKTVWRAVTSGNKTTFAGLQMSFEEGSIWDGDEYTEAERIYNYHLKNEKEEVDYSINAMLQDKMKRLDKDEDEAKSLVRSQLTKYLKPIYIEAFETDDKDTMISIRKLMAQTGVYGSVNKTVATSRDWENSHKKDVRESAYEAKDAARMDLYNAWVFKSKAKADTDSEGNTITGSKKQKVLEYIDSLDLKKKEKDEIYLALGYSESELKNTPWH